MWASLHLHCDGSARLGFSPAPCYQFPQVLQWLSSQPRVWETLGSRHTLQDRKMLCFQRGNSFAVSFVISEKGGKECWDCALSSSFCMAKFPCDSGKFTTVCNGKFILSLHWSFCFRVWLLLSKHSASVQACHPPSFPGFFF